MDEIYAGNGRTCPLHVRQIILPYKIGVVAIIITLGVLTLLQLSGIVTDGDRRHDSNQMMFAADTASHLSSLPSLDNRSSVESLLNNVVNEAAGVISAAIYLNDGVHIEIGGHHSHPGEVVMDRPIYKEIKVPIEKDGLVVGTLELAFGRQPDSEQYSIIEIAIFILCTILLVLIVYLFFNKRFARHFDTISIIPEKTRNAFNALSEGLIIVNEQEKIVLANDSFISNTGQNREEVIGRNIDKLHWKQREEGGVDDILPWHFSLYNCERKTGVPVRLESNNKTMTFSVNTAPIFDSLGAIRGVLATFDDLTDLEKQHRKLRSTLSKLRSSEKALRDKTIELEYLATRDPLTGCLNRRAFFDKLDLIFEQSKAKGYDLVFIMVDIDNFKWINDVYGHANGDKIIKLVAEILNSNSRPEDVVGRYGGDEFTLALPKADIEQAMAIAERLRLDIQNKCRTLFTNRQQVTLSFGLAELHQQMEDSILLVNNADDALYAAKQQGKNRIVTWKPGLKKSVKQDIDKGEEIILPPEKADETATVGLLQAEIEQLESTVKQLESELEYTRDEIRKQGSNDELTGLPVKLIFDDRVSRDIIRAQRNKQSVAVVSLDIDNFSRINEAFGHGVGDQILKIVAERLVQYLRRSDTVAVLDSEDNDEISTVTRLHNDEFALVLSDIKDIKSVTWVIRRILGRLKKPMEVDNQEFFVSFSVGAAFYPHDGDITFDLLHMAYSARIAAKNDPGINNIRFFSKDLNRNAFHGIWLEMQFYKAIVHQQFEVVYQPKVSTKTGLITSMEALARWTHPKVGPIPPEDFIPVAEHTGLINKLGNWIFKKACLDLRRWHKMGFRDLRISVNLSALQLRDENALSERFLRICSRRKIPPSKIELEITESTLIENFEHTQAAMQAMSKAGIQFTLDEFGKGFSSLGYLQKLPIKNIKIDQAFVDSTLPDSQSQIIVKAIISMAKNLGLKVAAIGVETETQKHLLCQLDCDEIQGSYYSDPVTMRQATNLLRRYNGNKSTG
ncbi:MAG: diguanylate cyclase [Candidatus Thiodiazotropha sp. (ex Ctena orbiculata)]|uniref:Diguanylate cyclase n=1 Tax=Candidatus Thiodiazotropha taylori TaxID=2792791 RepID=A0A944MBV4_9GAMM|nr:diguanylate cyclase [Candidatus Thiodiazotropha taylori]MBV2137854.1 diguanylate cyclase [Candidatus Thiodiazotropha taylori]